MANVLVHAKRAITDFFKSKPKPEPAPIYVESSREKKSVPIEDYRQEVYEDELRKQAKEAAKKQAIARAKEMAERRFPVKKAQPQYEGTLREGFQKTKQFLAGTPQQQKHARQLLRSSQGGMTGLLMNPSPIDTDRLIRNMGKPQSIPKARTVFVKHGKYYKKVTKRPKIAPPHSNSQADFMKHIMRY